MPEEEKHWILTTTPCPRPSKIVFGSGRFVEVGYDYSASSTDGSLWTRGTLPTNYLKDSPYDNLAFGDGKFIGVSPNSVSEYYKFLLPRSSDGITWESVNSPYTGSGRTPAYSIVYGGNRFIAFFMSGSISAWQYPTYCSDDAGITWVSLSNAPDKILHPVYANGRFVGANNSSAYISMDNGATWAQTGIGDSQNWADSVYAGGKIIFIAPDTDKIRYSENDGTTWKEAVLPFADSWVGIAYGAGKYVIISKSGNVVFSTNGTKWRQAESLPEVPLKDLNISITPASGDWVSIAYGNGRFVAAHNYGLPWQTGTGSPQYTNEEFCAYIIEEDVKPMRNINLWVGVDGKARKAARMWVGVDGKAREVVAGWVGDENGKARRWF